MAALRFFCFWPGLSTAWQQGSARGLLIAVLFAWAVCLIMLANLVWPDWISVWFLRVLFSGTIIFWCIEFVRERVFSAPASPAFAGDNADSFTKAQLEYLRGNWFDAEALLLDLTTAQPGDIVAGLLLVGVLRRTQRESAALRRLEQLCLYDSANAWRFEIERERERISAAIEAKMDALDQPQHE